MCENFQICFQNVFFCFIRTILPLLTERLLATRRDKLRWNWIKSKPDRGGHLSASITLRKRSACLSRRLPSSRSSSSLVPLSSWFDATVHPRRVCSRQRIITIASRHEPLAESYSATRGSFNIDNTPRARSPRVFLSFSLSFSSSPFTAPFLACLRVILCTRSLLADHYRRALLD